MVTNGRTVICVAPRNGYNTASREGRQKARNIKRRRKEMKEMEKKSSRIEGRNRRRTRIKTLV